MARGGGPETALVALGYAGWSAGQLENEIAQNAWLTAPCDERILFDTPYEQRWRAAGRLLGIDLTTHQPPRGTRLMAGEPAPPSPQLILAFDFGTRRIGLAAGDTLTRTARGLSTLDCGPRHAVARDRQGLRRPAAVAARRRPAPQHGRHADGADRPPRARSRPSSRRAIASRSHWSTSASAPARPKPSCATREPRGLKRGRATHADVDMIAARILLERWFAGEAEASTMRAHDS